MKKRNNIFIIILLSAVVGCSSVNSSTPTPPDSSNTSKAIAVSMLDYSGILKLDSILMDNLNTKVILQIMDGKKFMTFAPGTYNCFFFMDPITKKEYKLLSGEGVIFNEEINGPGKFTLTFEKLDEGIKIIHLIGGKEALIGERKTVGFYDINLGK